MCNIYKEEGFIDSASCSQLQDNLPDKMRVVVYSNGSSKFDENHSKIPNFHVFDGAQPWRPISFNTEFDITKLPNLVFVKNSIGHLKTEYQDVISKWLLETSNLRSVKGCGFTNWQVIVLNWDSQNQYNTLNKHLKKCSPELKTFHENFYNDEYE